MKHVSSKTEPEPKQREKGSGPLLRCIAHKIYLHQIKQTQTETSEQAMKLFNLLLISLAYFVKAKPGVLRSKTSTPEDNRVSAVSAVSEFPVLFNIY